MARNCILLGIFIPRKVINIDMTGGHALRVPLLRLKFLSDGLANLHEISLACNEGFPTSRLKIEQGTFMCKMVSKSVS